MLITTTPRKHCYNCPFTLPFVSLFLSVTVVNYVNICFLRWTRSFCSWINYKIFPTSFHFLPSFYISPTKNDPFFFINCTMYDKERTRIHLLFPCREIGDNRKSFSKIFIAYHERLFDNQTFTLNA